MTIIADVPPIFAAVDDQGLPPLQTRAALVQDLDVDTGIVQCRLAPYEVEAQIDDGLFEVFTRGAFSAAVDNPARCKMSNQGHDRSTYLGRATMLRDADDGLYGTIKVSDTVAGRDLLVLLRDEVLTEVSVEFRPQRRRMRVERRDGNILVRHDKATLVGVSPVANGAYGDSARVLSVRAAQADRARERVLAHLQSLTAGPKNPPH